VEFKPYDTSTSPYVNNLPRACGYTKNGIKYRILLNTIYVLY